ncbi:hypothetical protein IMZ11_19020 [Microtetraspora sp. AC03309]|uniref:hypothetical protein n=1 Tax=Microtetraspora sp. AC03309 TaxID=2779376 RepID=UPI001E3D044B|nr:hypothetical protein [Microtetraspora sp. AC03309]MCC5577721.1 hypothetical protein [Microtetraspora sp. AC03309]
MIFNASGRDRAAKMNPHIDDSAAPFHRHCGVGGHLPAFNDRPQAPDGLAGWAFSRAVGG